MSDDNWYRYCHGCDNYKREKEFKIDNKYCDDCVFILYYTEYNEILIKIFGKDITCRILNYI